MYYVPYVCLMRKKLHHNAVYITFLATEGEGGATAGVGVAEARRLARSSALGVFAAESFLISFG